MWLSKPASASEAAAVYARFGAHAARYGTLAAWATELLNVLTGNLDPAYFLFTGRKAQWFLPTPL